MVGKRSCEWQSGTTPAFAAVFRSNTHTLPNYRAPIIPETHDNELCQSRTCQAAMQDSKEPKRMAKMAQRACRECTRYHSGYTFKRQPIGAKYVNAAAETLNYLNAKMQLKTHTRSTTTCRIEYSKTYNTDALRGLHRRSGISPPIGTRKMSRTLSSFERIGRKRCQAE